MHDGPAGLNRTQNTAEEHGFDTVFSFSSQPFGNAEPVAGQFTSFVQLFRRSLNESQIPGPAAPKDQKFAKYCIDISRSFLVDDGESTAKMA